MSQKFYQLKKKEVFFLIFLMALYGMVAYYKLGDRIAPETYSVCTDQASEFLFEVDSTPSTIKLYAPVNDASKYIGIEIYGSSDQQNWVKLFDTRDDDSDYTAAMIWYDYPLATADNIRYIRIKKLDSANRLALSEIAFYGSNHEKILTKALNSRSEKLLDEQETIPENKNRMNSAYFDESFFPSSALEMQDGLSVAEMDHPAVGRLIIGIGMDLFGRNPFGFRFMQAFVGIIMLPLIYMMAKALFQKVKWAMLSASFLALDFLHYTQTRIGTLDAFLVLFIMAMYAFMLFYRKSTTVKGRYINLLLSGLFMGLGIGTKWSACYAAAGLAVLYFYWLIKDWKIGSSEKHRAQLKECVFCVIAFIMIPLCIYAISYIPYAKTIPDQSYWETLIGHQIQMFTYHTGSQTHTEHPYASRWWTWLLALKPVFYYYEAPPASIHLYATGNPIAWGMGLLGILAALVTGIVKKKDSGIFIAAGYFSQLIPWMFISRDTFLYHYFPMVPFLTLGVVYLFKETWTGKLFKKYKTGYIIMYTVTLLATFIIAFPFIFGSSMLWETILTVRKVFLTMAVVFMMLWSVGWVTDLWTYKKEQE